MQSTLVLTAFLATLSSAGTGPWFRGDVFGGVVCETTDGSPFTTDCDNAAKSLADWGGTLSRAWPGQNCWTVRDFHTCAIALCNGEEGDGKSISAREVAFWARTINARCAFDLGNNHSPYSGGQVGARNVDLGDVQVQLWHTGHNKRSEPSSFDGYGAQGAQDAQARSLDKSTSSGSLTTRASQIVRSLNLDLWEEIAGEEAGELSRRAVGDGFTIRNTGFELFSMDESGGEQCSMSRDEERAMRDSVRQSVNDPGPLGRTAHGETLPHQEYIRFSITMQTGVDGNYVSDISDEEWRRIYFGMLEFRRQTGSRSVFQVALHSRGVARPMGWINFARRF